MNTNEYFKRISNPLSTISKEQKDMMGSFRKNINRQKRSRETRLRILAERRARTPAPVSDDSDVSSCRTAALSSSDVVVTDTDTDTDIEFETPAPRVVPPPSPAPLPTPPATPQLPRPPPLSSPFSAPVPTSASSSAHTHDNSALYADELDARMSDLGLKTAHASSARSQEIQYWRKKVSLEEEAAVKQAGMLLSLLSSFVESFTNAVGFTTIRTQGLSDAIQTALESGDFDLAIKSYCVSPQALSLLKNPVTSFMTSFGHVVLRTHIENVKRELSEGIQKFKTAREHPSSVMSSPKANVVDPSGISRPMFNLDKPTKPCLSDSFQSNMSKIAPVLGMMTKLSAVINEPASCAPSPEHLQLA